MQFLRALTAVLPFTAWMCACATSAAPPAPSVPTNSLNAGASGSSSQATPGASASTAPPASKAGPAGAMCGGIAGFGCADGLFCSFAPEASCGAADQTGICQPKPEMCTEQYEPVCGCNDKTYGNACHAAREGVSVGRRGECTAAASPTLTQGQLCGTRGVAGECGPGLYCKYKSQCGATDTGGTCELRPQMCTKIYKPVCGCDGKTYGSECVAASAGVAIQQEGACKSSQ